MSSVLHPVGPEPSPTYWVRRALVVGAAVLVLAIVIALIVNGTSRGSAVQPNPSPPVVQTVAADTPSPSPLASTMRTASPLSSESASAEPSATRSATPSAKQSSKVLSKATGKQSPSATKTATPASSACAPSALRPTLTGKQRLKPKQPNRFSLSLINGSGQTCVVTVNSTNFELKIYSGKDRIWSTNDCAAVVKPITKKVAREQAVAWAMTWDGHRSRSVCRTRPEIPRAGTYFATAQLDGAKPVQLRMILHK